MVLRFPGSTEVTQRALRVLHIPGEHAYVRHLQPITGSTALFRTLPDPTPPAAAGRWHPSPVLDPAWLAAHAGGFDVVHLHFGYEHLTPAEVTGWATAVHAAGAALVVTVHDVDNPHLSDQSGHHGNLRAVLGAADRVITLTPGAAALIRQRWGREAVVIPHPHLLPLELVGTRSTPRSLAVPQIGVPLGALRANVDTAAVLHWLAGWPGPLPTVRVSHQVFDDGRDDPGRTSARDALLAGADRGTWQLDVVEPGVPEEQIWQWLSALDAIVLPYRWGTHSGWVEACADVGTSIIAPDLGYWAEQHPLLTVPRWAESSAGDAAVALQRLCDPEDDAGGGLGATTRAQRTEQRVRIHHQHAESYVAARSRSEL